MGQGRPQPDSEAVTPRTSSYLSCFSKLSKGSTMPLKPEDLLPLFPQSRRLCECLHEMLSTAPSFVQTAKTLTEYRPQEITIPCLKKLLNEGTVYRFLSLMTSRPEFDRQFAKDLFDQMCLVVAGSTEGNEMFFQGLGLEAKVTLDEMVNALRYKLPSLATSLSKQFKAIFSDRWQAPEQSGSIITTCQWSLLSLTSTLFESHGPKKLYDSTVDGRSINALAGKVAGYPAKWMIVIQHQHGVLGAVQQGLYELPTAQGSSDSCLFAISPQLRMASASEGKGEKNYCFFFTKEKYKKGLGFGFTAGLQNFALWLDDSHLSVSFQRNGTYGPAMLAEKEELDCERIEVWALGTAADLQALKEAQAGEAREIDRMRKVNKAELVNDISSGLLGDTFKHREEMAGDMEHMRN